MNAPFPLAMQRYAMADIAEALGISKQAAQKRANKEEWPSVQAGRGMAYQLDSLPKDVQSALNIADSKELLAQAKAMGSAIGKQLAADAHAAETDRALTRKQAAEAILQRWPSLTSNQVKRMEARHDIVGGYQAWLVATRRVSGNKTLREFAALFNATGAGLSGTTREAVKKTSDRNLRRWVDGFNALGLAGLLDEKNGSQLAGSGKIEDQQEIKNLVVSLMVEFPHIKPAQVEASITARFRERLAPGAWTLQKAVKAGLLAKPEDHAIRGFMAAWKKQNRAAYVAITNPDKYKNEIMLAHGSASEEWTYLNECWEMDSTPGDVMLLDGRHHIVGIIDVWSRRMKLLVTKTSKAEAIGCLTRRCVLDWGMLDVVKHDNGSDYVALFMTAFFSAMDIERRVCAPFSPWQKPHIERGLQTFSHGLLELKPGFIGHSVAERSAIESRSAFSERLFKKDGVLEVAMTAADLQAFCDDWVNNIYMHNEHDGLGGMTPFAKVASYTGQVTRVEDERALDVLLMPLAGRDGWFTVQKKGLKIDGEWFSSPDLAYLDTGSRVMVRRDVTDLGRAYVFNDQGAYACIVLNGSLAGINRQEFAAKAKAIQSAQVSAEKKALKQLAKAQKVSDIADEIMRDRAIAAGKLAVLQPKVDASHSTAGLKAAGQAARATDMPQPSQRAAELQALAAKVMAEAPVNVTPLPTAKAHATPLEGMTTRERYALWLTYEALIKAHGGDVEALAEAWQRRFFRNFPQSSIFRAEAELAKAQKETAAR